MYERRKDIKSMGEGRILNLWEKEGYKIYGRRNDIKSMRKGRILNVWEKGGN